jgi:hypothetical protein
MALPHTAELLLCTAHPMSCLLLRARWHSSFIIPLSLHVSLSSSSLLLSPPLSSFLFLSPPLSHSLCRSLSLPLSLAQIEAKKKERMSQREQTETAECTFTPDLGLTRDVLDSHNMGTGRWDLTRPPFHVACRCASPGWNEGGIRRRPQATPCTREAHANVWPVFFISLLVLQQCTRPAVPPSAGDEAEAEAARPQRDGLHILPRGTTPCDTRAIIDALALFRTCAPVSTDVIWLFLCSCGVGTCSVACFTRGARPRCTILCHADL